MKIPKYIEKALKARARAAHTFRKNDVLVGKWLKKNNITVEDYDIWGGCEAYVNPDMSIDRIKQAIQDK